MGRRCPAGGGGRGAAPRPRPRGGGGGGPPPAVSVPKHRQKVNEHEAARAIEVGSGTSADAALVRAAQAGDVRAFGALYERHRQAVYRYCLARSSSPHEAEDLVSEVFLKAMESLARYRDQGLPFVAFLYRVARNAAIDRSRKDKGSSLFDMAVEPRSGADVEGDAARAADMGSGPGPR